MNTPDRTAGLLDVNVLVALAWPNHTGHRTARAWLGGDPNPAWATTPFTEAGFVRVSSNRVLPTSTSPQIAVEMLRQLCAIDGHEFWSDEVRFVTGEPTSTRELRGHRQVTDAHLVALAAMRSSHVVTFDRGLLNIAEDPGQVRLLVP